MTRKVYVAGHRGMVGSALMRQAPAQKMEWITADRQELDLRDTAAVERFLHEEKPDQIILAAAKVGGILANQSNPVDFLLDNLRIQNNVIAAAHEADVQQLLFLGSSCIYPRDAAQPIVETALLNGDLEKTNDAYAIAKIAGIKLCEAYHRQYGRDYRSAMPTNLYGPGDQFDLKNSHVIPAMLRRFHEAKVAHAPEVVVWGSGTPLREFMHVDDLARACWQILEVSEKRYWAVVDSHCSHVNVGSGEEVSIAELAALVAKTVDYRGKLVFDTKKPDGTPRKKLDLTRLSALGFTPQISLQHGLEDTYQWWQQQPRYRGQ